MNNKITFSNKIHGNLDFTMSDLIAWRKYSDDEEQPEIINLHPQADQIAEPKKGRGRPKKLFQVVPEIIPELIIHQHPAPACSVKDRQPYEVEPEPEIKRKVGRPRKIIEVIKYA